MKRLFTLRNSKTGHYVPFITASGSYLYFEDKQDAKAARDIMNEKRWRKNKLPLFVVSKGPDHFLINS